MSHLSCHNATAHEPSPGVGDGHVVGIDIGGSNLRLALADGAGRILAKWSASTVGMCHEDAVIDLISSGVAHLLAETSIPRSSLRAVAAGAPGITDVHAGIVLATSYLMGWSDVPLRTLLESSLGVPAAIDNDVNLAALGESWAGAARGTRDFVFLAIGTGIGAGIMLHGNLFHGMGWTAGEIGYMLVPGTSAEPVKRGEPGALEAIAGGEGIRKQWQRLWTKDGTSLPESLCATEIFDHAVKGDALAQRILHGTAQTLSYAIYNISLVLSCPLFVLGGGVGMHPALYEATRAALIQSGTRAMPELIRSALGGDAQLTGAIRLALDVATSQPADVATSQPAGSSVEAAT